MASIKSAASASATDSDIPYDLGAALLHGGNLAMAHKLFPDAPEPFVDLSTGINPHPYPLPHFAPELFARLPALDALERLTVVAAAGYGAPSADHVVAAPGTQILLPLVAALVPSGRAVVLGPTYGEFARAAALAGHDAMETTELAGLANADLALVANPNNPDGRVIDNRALVDLAAALKRRGGLLMVDEAFMEVGPAAASLAGAVSGNIVVLRSFGKFYGLAGLRLGFALAAPALAARLAASLGPWAVSGPAIEAGLAALGDHAWRTAMKLRLATAASQLDMLLADAGLAVIGGTSLFRLVRTGMAAALFHHLGRAGILVRRFDQHAGLLRFGLPADAGQWKRLRVSLAEFGSVPGYTGAR